MSPLYSFQQGTRTMGSNNGRVFMSVDGIDKLFSKSSSSRGLNLQALSFSSISSPAGQGLAVLSDGSKCMKAVTLGDATGVLASPSLRFPCNIQVHEYVFSRDTSKPFFAIGAVTASSAITGPGRQPQPITLKNHPGAERGLSFIFFRDVAATLKLGDIIGTDNEATRRVSKLDSFLGRHYAIMALLKLKENGHATPNTTAYTNAMKNYRRIRKNDEKTSLSPEMRGNAGFKLLLDKDITLNSSEPPTPESILSWYSKLVEGHPTLQHGVGKWRDWDIENFPGAKFVPPDRIQSYMENVCTALEKIWSHVTLNRNDTSRMVALASSICFAILDVHPFPTHVNSLVARTSIEWALGFPFKVPVYSEQKIFDDFTLAIKQCRSNTSLEVSTEWQLSDQMSLLREATIAAGALQPLSAFLLEFFEQEMEFFDELYKKEEVLLSNDIDKLSKQIRENSKGEDCFICFAASPNMSLLCCGKPAHLNCVTRWCNISRNRRCPHCQCRSAFPPPRTGARGNQRVIRLGENLSAVNIS